ncbi:MAG TPA: sugar phosphate nucleotidyltransferase [Bacillota bacterium]|nr:sugar phosphate nucleotidyltransferase [Clostridiaceae bacterium]HNR03599.1 sugar phosphate nucleotidyltransferase [Bacillota bacterium]HNT02587.1 sugar phosphate nucleotidyltransferase [Bacillota bacterium]HOH88560.1 sugar phosphate nucleotidyltransferase [Bacillota bacterium]HPX68278.1 sugar phosphate nucleotidyltransferase [Bacillota bacterium]
MKGIILAGGTGSRLYPLTKVTNKHLLPVGKHPMIDHLIAKIKQAGICDIMVITGKEHMGAVVNLLGSGHDYGVKFTYRIQDQPGGIAQALGLCEEFVHDDRCLVILGDNIFEDDISEYVENFMQQEKGAKILIKKVPDPQRYGVAELKGGNIVGIEEKPEKPKSDCCVTGIYMYDNRVFNVIKSLKPSNRGELEITDVNNWYIKDGSLTFDVLEGWWTDAGTFSSFAYANELAKDKDLSGILCRDYEILREAAITKE